MNTLSLDAVTHSLGVSYERMVEMADEGIWVLDHVARIQFVNPRLAAMLGYSQQALCGHSALEFLDPRESRALAHITLTNRQRQNEEFQQLRFLHKDGRSLLVKVGSTPLFDAGGNYTGSMGVLTDMTLRAQMEAREAARARALYLIATGADLPAILDAIVLGVEAQHPGALCSILLLDASGDHVTLGSAPHLPSFYNDAIHGAPIGPRAGSCGTAAYTGKRVIVENINTDPLWDDYRALALQAGLESCWSEPIRDSAGKVLGTFAIYHREPHRPDDDDIETIAASASLAAIAIERCRDQRRVLEMNEELEQKVRIRTLELNREKDRAEAASRAKSEFVSNISHEIRTPMHSIQGLLELLGKTGLDETQSAYLGKIDLAVQHLLGIINSVLDFSRIETGKFQLDRQHYSLRAVLNNVESQLANSAASKGLNLVFHVAEGVPDHLYGDPLRLGQVLINYIGNAIKFSDHGDIRISAKLINQDGRTCKLRFLVRDQGIGIPQEVQKSLFRPFEQGDSSTTREYGGTGLGLAICRNIVEATGGQVGVESEPGKGSEFWFTTRMGITDGKVPQHKDRLEPEELQRLQGCQILLVEDNEVNQMVARELLMQAGVDVAVASNGQQALEALGRQRYDAVLMDVQMPVMDGYEATRRIRQTPALRDNVIIAMTANAGREDKQAAFAAGVDDFVSKPIRAVRLYQALLKNMALASFREGEE
ncbi:response regulator [Alcanivorax sp.]|uniref:response regulator n=1 Tax=Alcanivorax sp. TaxID=1872427 RepID=UPI0025C259EC|nr:response regulator [Alcanivorax sp.]